MNKLTFGGLPASSAWQWDKSNNEMFGKIIVALASQDEETQKKAYIQFYEMRRHFMAEDFDTMMDMLNQYRADHGFEDVSIILDRIGARLVNNGLPETPAPANRYCHKADLHFDDFENAQQLTLF